MVSRRSEARANRFRISFRIVEFDKELPCASKAALCMSWIALPRLGEALLGLRTKEQEPGIPGILGVGHLPQEDLPRTRI